MTPQQILDKVTEHLFKQGIASKNEIDDRTQICAYRGTNGTSCAVGCLIPDEVYESRMENVRVYDIVHKTSGVQYNQLPGFIADNLNLLEELQETHDRKMPSFKVDQYSDPHDIELYDKAMHQVRSDIEFIAQSYSLMPPWHLIPKQYHPVD